MNKNKIFYGWFIVIAGHFLIFLDGLLLYSFGIFLPYLSELFEMSRTVSSSIFSLRCLVLAAALFIAGSIIDKYNPKYVTLFGGLIAVVGIFLSAFVTELWQLYITYGIMIGFGDGFLYIVPVTIISRWFKEKRALAIGIATTGVPISGLLINPITAWLVETYSGNAFVILSIIFLVILVLSSLVLVGYPEDIGVNRYGDDGDNLSDSLKNVGWHATDAFKTKSFWMLYLTFFFGFNTFLIIIINLYNYCVDVGISPIIAAGAPAAIGLGSILGRLFFSGILTNYLKNVRILFVCYFFQACSIVIILFLSNTWTLYLFGFLFGFFYSGWVPMFPVIIGDFFGLKSLGKIFGLMGTGFSLAALTGPLIAGLIYDLTNSYFHPFLFATVACIITSFITFLIKPPIKYQLK